MNHDADRFVREWRALQTFCAVMAVLQALMICLTPQRWPVFAVLCFAVHPTVYVFAKRRERERRAWLDKWGTQ